MTQQIRSALSRFRRQRTGWAVAIVVFDATLFVLLIAIAVAAASHAVRICAGIGAGFQTLRLASIAHDAGHLNYTGRRSWDKFLARLAFLPALQPFGTWEAAHNVIHHSWTSIRGKDYVWIPFAKDEFESLSASRRTLEHAYRSAWGHGLYYLIELWLLRVFIPAFRWNEVRRRSHRRDILLTAAFAAAWGAAAAFGAVSFQRNPITAVAYAEVLPFLVWCELFGLTLYLQHTHPRARFFRDRLEWEFCGSQTASATNVQFPKPVEWLLHGIFEHTAHHLDTSIPFYELHQAQVVLNGVLAGRNVVYRWSWRGFLDCCRKCKLYDYDRHCWLSFDGSVTAP